jgi:hypothetical protein
MCATPVRYVGVVYASFLNRDKFDRNREILLKNIIEEVRSPITKYVLVGDVGIPRGIIFFVPVFLEVDLERAQEELERLELGVALETYIVSKVIVGSFCFRKFDKSGSELRTDLDH